MKHYVVKFEVAVIVAAKDPSSAKYDAKLKLAGVDGIECTEDTGVFSIDELLRMDRKHFREVTEMAREE